jgi:hypothetical protein
VHNPGVVLDRNIPFGFLMFFGSIFIILFALYYYLDSKRKGPYYSDNTNDPLLLIEHLQRKNLIQKENKFNIRRRELEIVEEQIQNRNLGNGQKYVDNQPIQ